MPQQLTVLASLLILLLETRLIAIYIYMEYTVKNRVCGRLSAQVSIELYQIRLRRNDIKSPLHRRA